MELVKRNDGGTPRNETRLFMLGGVALVVVVARE